MFGVLRTVFQALALVAAVVGIVERPGEGAAKKAEVMGIVRERLPELVSLPSWVREMFIDSAFLGWIIDLVVWAANKYGFFGTTSDGEAASTTP